MRFVEILRFELAHRVRSPTTWLYALFLFLATNWLFLANGSDAGPVHLNAPARLAEAMAVASIFGMLVSAALFSDVGTRDTAVEMDPLLYTTPLRPWEYLGGRFAATVLVNWLIVLMIPLGLLVNLAINPLDGTLGPWRLLAFVQPMLLMLLPNVLVVGAILFTIATRTKQVLPVYLGAAAMFFSYLMSIEYRLLLEDTLWSTLADPLWLARLQLMVGTWTPAEQNDRLIGVPAAILANRAVWLTVAALVIWRLSQWFRMAHAVGGGGRRPTTERAEAVIAMVGAAVALPSTRARFGAATPWRQLWSTTRLGLTDIMHGRGFLLTILAAIGLPLLWGWNVSTTVFDTSTWPVTMLVAETVMGTRVIPLVWLLLAVWAGELSGTEREVGLAEIGDATPVSDGVRFGGRLLALSLLVVLLHVAFLIAGLLLQTLQGYTHYELVLYAEILFGMLLVDHLLFALLALVIHALVNQKYLGHVVVMMAFILTRIAPALLTRHNLLIYGGDPGWTYSTVAGFGPFVTPWLWFKAYWVSWAVILGVVATVFAVRGRDTGWRRRLAAARERFRTPLVGVASLAGLAVVGTGGFIFYNTNVLNAYRGPRDVSTPLATYETRYKRYEAASQPRIMSVDLRVELYPDTPRAEITGHYVLVNTHTVAIDSLHVLRADDAVTLTDLRVDRGADMLVTDDEVGYRILRLHTPLAPGDSMRLHFTVQHTPRGFPNSDVPTAVRRDGASFNRRWLPFIGYQAIFEVTDAERRARLGLPERERPSPDAARGNRFRFTDADLVHTRVVIGTSADQIAVTPGALTRQWTNGDRAYFEYTSDAPTAFGTTVYAGRYTVQQDRWRDVSLRVYHHPAHQENIDRTFAGMKAGLEYLSANIGPYPDRHLRVVEFPRFGGYGIAHPNTIGFAEDYFLSRVREGEVDQPFYGTVHEVAHQWWGGIIRGANTPGYAMLSESLANYTAMVVTERTQGAAAGRTIYRAQMDRYLNGRAEQGREVPLLDVEDQPYIAYRKGALVLYNLRAMIGEPAVTAALKSYHDRFRDQGPPFATSRDLYAELKKVAPDSLHGWMADMFEQVTLWDLQIDDAETTRNSDGTYALRLHVLATKLRADSEGRESEIPLDDLVEFEAVGEDEAPLYRGRHQIRSGAQTITITTTTRPIIAAVDPDRRLFDRQEHNNRLEVRETPSERQP